MSMRSSTVVFGAMFLVALPCLVFTGCKEKQPSSAPPMTASVAPVTRGDLSNTLTVAGEFQPYQEVELHAKVSGYIRHINVDIGDLVKNGQVIATLEVPELNAQVAGSEAEVRHSKSEIARAQSGVALAEASQAALHAAYRLRRICPSDSSIIDESICLSPRAGASAILNLPSEGYRTFGAFPRDTNSHNVKIINALNRCTRALEHSTVRCSVPLHS